MIAPRASSILIPVGALGIAAAWPLSAYFLHPAILPAAMVAIAAGLLIVRRPEWGIGLVLALAPLTNTVVGGSKPLHLALPAITGAVLIYGLLIRRVHVWKRASGVSLAVMVFCGAGVISALFALDPAQSVTRLFVVITSSLLFFAVLRVADRADRVEVVITGVLLALLLAAAHGLAQQILGQFGSSGGVAIDGEVIRRTQGSFGHPNAYAGFLAVLTPLALAVALMRALPGRLRVLAAAAALLAVQPLLFSFTRGAIVALVAGLLVWLTVRRPRMAIVAAAVIAVLAFAFTPAALRERLRDDRTGSDIGLRADLWRAALEIYGQSPVVGVGLNNFSEAYARLPTTVSAGIQRRLLHNEQVLVPPHANNLALNVLAEEGLVGLVALLALLGSGLALATRLSKVREPMAQALSIGLGAGLVVMITHSLLEITLFGEVGLPLFALLGVGGVVATLERDPAPSEVRPARA